MAHLGLVWTQAILLVLVTIVGVLVTRGECDTFHNPLFDYNSPDPFVIRHGDFYYMTLSDFTKMTVLKSKILTNWREAETSVVYTLSPGWFNLWAPEIHFIDGNFYIYFTMEDGLHANHRMYVMKADDPTNPLGSWSQPLKLTVAAEDYFAIDGTVLQYGNGQLYFIWSGWANLTNEGPISEYKQTMYIAPMSDPMTISGPRAHIREPGRTWEWHPNWGYLNEGPEILKYANRTFLVYSASSTWTPEYCLGYLVLENSKDPMVPDNWVQDYDGCVFYKNDAQGVWGPGHASFTTSPDGKESWMVYHALDDINNPGTNRTARAERILWNYDYTPVFPRPSGFGAELDTPSGQ